MLTFKKSANISNITFDKIILISKEIERFTQIPEVTPIPSNSIIHKTITGIGATHSEIIAERHSIIVLPHISIVTSKHKYYQNGSISTFAVYGDITLLEIENYIFSDVEYCKFLTTPKGVDKIIKVMNANIVKFPILQYKKLFFILIDECHKLIQNAKYRTDMLQVMEHFFDFENKAMVSATPIPPSDPRFAEHNFKHIKISPDFKCEVNRKRYIHDIELIHADSEVNGFKTYLVENEAEHYFVFFNSIQGIKSLIEKLNINDNYKIFCSKESTDILRKNNELNTSCNIDSFTKYNFFTSSFFNGLDIILNYKPNLVIISNCGYRLHTALDPFTDILQIIGRFRKKNIDDIPYNKVTHINNANSFTNPLSEENVLHNIEMSKFSYTQIETLKYSLKGNEHYPLFDQALSTQKPYFELLTTDNLFSWFLKDNYINDERVKHYYQNASALRTAYLHTELYTVVNKKAFSKKSELLSLQKRNIRYSNEMNRLMANILLELDNYKLLEVYYAQRKEVARLSYLAFEAYNRLGYPALKQMNFKKRLIDKAILELNIEEGSNLFPVINVVYSTFQLGQYYTYTEVKVKLQQIFNKYNIPSKATSKDIERYFEHRSKDSKKDGKRVYVFTKRKFLEVAQQKHI